MERRYEFYVWVERTVSRKWAQRTIEMLCKCTDDGVFDDFPKISEPFPKISENFPKLCRRPDERFWTFSENFHKFPKVSEDFWRLPKTFEEDPKMFQWYMYTNEFKYNLRDKLYVNAGLLVGRGKKSQISWDFQGQIRGKNGRFRGNFEASFAEKWLVMNGRFRRSFPSKFRWKAIGFALIWGMFSMKLDTLIAFTQASYRNMKSYFTSKLIEHDKNK